MPLFYNYRCPNNHTWQGGIEGRVCPQCEATVPESKSAFYEDSPEKEVKEEFTGGSVDYYKIGVSNPTTPGVKPYTAECNDIIEGLQMTYAEANVLKAVWRLCASRLGKQKRGYEPLYDAEKVEFFGKRLVVRETNKEGE